MEKHHKLIITAFLLITIAAGVGIVTLGKSQKASSSLAAPVEMLAPAKTVKPSALPSTVTVESPDGKMVLTIISTKNGGNTVWTVSADGREILNETLPAEADITIPFNTFSPDNKYIFLQKTVGGSISYPVLSTGGADISKDGQQAEIAGLFAAKFPEYKITSATGWGGINLVVFNTQKTDGSPGPSFWFEVPSHAFIRLSNTFN
jgi:hypothetical protein